MEAIDYNNEEEQRQIDILTEKLLKSDVYPPEAPINEYRPKNLYLMNLLCPNDNQCAHYHDIHFSTLQRFYDLLVLPLFERIKKLEEENKDLNMKLRQHETQIRILRGKVS